MNRIYVGNLSYDTGADQLSRTFAEFGTVESVTIVRNRRSGRSRGFGFVQMSGDAGEAIAALHGGLLDGRRLNISLAHVTSGLEANGSHPSSDGACDSASHPS
ncbi:MAG: RNA-binding protein [Planctomycetaceae bacterium]